MFGIMRPKNNCQSGHCSTSKNDYLYHRKHYCGSCKTIGNDYGQSARLLLNYDVVFLSELLSDLSGENPDNWQKAYQAINVCFKMPDKNEERPLSLQYAAAINVFLGELKIKDNLADDKQLKWRLINNGLSKSFQKAVATLENFGLDVNDFYQQNQLQQEREESQRFNFQTIKEVFDCYAAATSEMTGQAFARGSQVVGGENSADLMQELGRNFGRLVYILDALEDLPKDFKKKYFNPLRPYLNTRGQLSENDFNQVVQQLYYLQTEIEQQFLQLEITTSRKQLYISRLALNLQSRIQKIEAQPFKRTLKQKLQSNWKQAEEKALELLCSSPKQPSNWQLRMMTFAVFIAPQASEDAVSIGVGRTSGWGLAFLAALISSLVIGASIKPLKAFFSKQKEALPIEPAKKKTKKSWWQRLWPRKRNPNNCHDTCKNCARIFFSILLVLGIVSILILILALFYPANPAIWITLLFVGIGLLLVYAAYLVILGMIIQDLDGSSAGVGLIVIVSLFLLVLGSLYLSFVFLEFLLVYSLMLLVIAITVLSIAWIIEGVVGSEVWAGLLFFFLALLILGIGVFWFIIWMQTWPVWLITLFFGLLVTAATVAWYILINV